MACQCTCNTDNKPQDADQQPVDPKVEEAKDLKEAIVETVEAGTVENE